MERFINRRSLKIHEILRDVGWLTLVFALIEFAYLMFVETATLNFGSAVSPLWRTEWPLFKTLFLEVAVGVMLVLTSVWLEQAGITEMPQRRRPLLRAQSKSLNDTSAAPKCDVEW